MHKLFLAMRYLRKRRIAFFGVAAVALCVALLIVITSLFTGFINTFQDNWQRQMGQVAIYPQYELHPWEQLAAELEKLESVASAAAVTETVALLYLGRGNVRAVQLIGVEPDRWTRDERVQRNLLIHGPEERLHFELSQESRQKAREWLEKRLHREVTESEMPVAAVVGIGLLGTPDELSDEYDYDKIVAEIEALEKPYSIISGKVKSGSGTDETVTARKLTRTCWPIDAVQTGMHLEDTKYVYLPFDYIRQLAGTRMAEGRYRCFGQIRLIVAEGFDEENMIADVREAWQRFGRETLAWPDAWVDSTAISRTMDEPHLKMITREIRKQLKWLQGIIGFICLVAMLLIFVILKMIVMQKNKEIGIIRAIGATRLGVAGLFLNFGLAIGSAGALLGVALGTWATRHIEFIESILIRLLGFKIWKSGVYMFREIPNQVDWVSVIWIVAVGIATAVIGALLPAIRAGLMPPVQTLRYE